MALLTAVVALGGPPLICHRIEIGNAKSLPWSGGDGWNGIVANYDRAKLTADTLALLTPDAPLPLRMETLRRAALYAVSDQRLTEEIALRLAARVLDSDAANAMAWFDAGYYVETVRQAALVYQWNMLSADEKANWKIRVGLQGIDGKKWVQRAARLGGKGVDAVLPKLSD